MAGIVRTAISLERGLLEKLDELRELLGIKSRSRAISEAIALFLSDKYWLLERGGDEEVTGSITVIYDHHEGGHDIAHVQHEFLDVIRSTSHIHLDERRCLEVILVRGRLSRIKEMIRRIHEMKGVKILRPIMIPLTTHGD